MTYAAAGLAVNRVASPRVTTIESVRIVGMSFLLGFLAGAGGSAPDRPVQAARLDTLGDVVIEVWTTRGIRPPLPAERVAPASRPERRAGPRRPRGPAGRAHRRTRRGGAPPARRGVERAGHLGGIAAVAGVGAGGAPGMDAQPGAPTRIAIRTMEGTKRVIATAPGRSRWRRLRRCRRTRSARRAGGGR